MGEQLAWKICALRRFGINIITSPPPTPMAETHPPVRMHLMLQRLKSVRFLRLEDIPELLTPRLGFYLPFHTSRHADRQTHTCRHTHIHSKKKKKQGEALDADSEQLCLEGVQSAGVFSALIININSVSCIHPFLDLQKCSICMMLASHPFQVRRLGWNAYKQYKI